MLLPRKALNELKKLVEDKEQDWQISFGERSATLATKDLTLMVRLVDGEFPPYRQVLPTGRKRRVLFERDAFASALKHVAIMAADRNHSVRFAFEPDKLIMTAQNVDAGDVREEIPVNMDGEPVYTGFNVRYFQDILSATRSEQLVLELGDPLDPCIARIPERDDCLFVVMPMRLD
jgi:DNA polymerase-3 subunit beta